MTRLNTKPVILIALTVLLMSACSVPVEESTPTPTSRPSATPSERPVTATVVRLPAVTLKVETATETALPQRELTLQIHTPIPAMAVPVAPDPDKDTIERATEDLAARLNVRAANVYLVTAVTDEYAWGDLLCPTGKEADLPIPAFSVGQEIVLAAGDQSYFYRAKGRMLVFCGER